jgi:hypothetical protein
VCFPSQLRTDLRAEVQWLVEGAAKNAHIHIAVGASAARRHPAEDVDQADACLPKPWDRAQPASLVSHARKILARVPTCFLDGGAVAQSRALPSCAPMACLESTAMTVLSCLD